MNLLLSTIFFGYIIKINSYILTPISSILYIKNKKLFSSLHNNSEYILNSTNQNEMTKIIINKSYGKFSFSNLFITEFEKIHNQNFDNMFNNNFYYYGENNKYNKNIDSRYDTKIIELYENLGGTCICSGKNANLTLVEIPQQLKKYIYIKEYFGLEEIFIHISQMYKELLNEIIDKRCIKYVNILEYKRILELEKYLQENKIEHF